METIVIQITNNKVLKILKDMEDLHLIKLLEHDVPADKKLSDKFGGKLNLTDEEYKNFQEHIARSRNEWGDKS